MERIVVITSTIGKVYTGKPGCMCGCNGKYAYASDYVEQGGKERGYDVDAEDVSDRSVKLVSNKIARYINALTDEQYKAAIENESIVVCKDYLWVHYKDKYSKGRYWAAYYKSDK